MDVRNEWLLSHTRIIHACGDAQNSTNEIMRNSLIKSCIAAWRVRTIMLREFNTEQL